MAIGSDTFVARSPETHGAALGSEVALLSISKGQYYLLNETAALIWDKLRQPIRVRDLCLSLAGDFSDTASISVDVQFFLNKLIDEQLVETRDSVG